ncbi:MAG: SMC family ATPase [Blastocatellia bacterium]
MLITKVELENIKNYEAGSFEFEAGVTAISGPNGAGKTTIIEAIAWALFDHLPYKKEDFLRRGAKKGAVRVTFVSALDGREYTVYRDTSTGYYIYDPVTKMRLVEQKQQVGAWIKQHLGIEAGVDLKSLFTSTIGVPQGTFTVDFAEQASKRKISFDKVLRVDEYQRSSEDLRALVRLVETHEGTLREEIARVEVEVSKLDGFLGERARYETLIKRMKQELSDAETARDRARTELNRLDELRKNIEQMTVDSAALNLRITESDRRLTEVAQEVKRSREASDIVRAAAAGYTDYNDANQKLAVLEPQAIERDSLKKELSEKEREQFKLEASVQTQRDKVSQLEADAKEIERLAPFVNEQEQIEKRRADLQTQLGEINALRRRQEAATKELESLRVDYADVSKKVEEAEKMREPAERVPKLEQERRTLEEELRELRVQLARISERVSELKRVRQTIAKLNGEIQTLEKEIESASNAEQIAASLSQLESDYRAVFEEATGLRLSIEREEKILSKMKGGLCPLLSERCLNMKDGQGLDQFFKLQVGNERERLKTVERTKEAIQSKLNEAKAASKATAGLVSQRVYYARLVQDIEIERGNAARFESDVSDTAINEQARRALEQRLGKLEENLKEAQIARSKYEKLDLLRERKAQLKAEGSEKRKEHEELEARLGFLVGLNDELDRIGSRLNELDDPRARARMLREGLAKEGETRNLLYDLEGREKQMAASIQDLLKKLEEFASLDRQLTQERERRAASERDHRAYIESQPIAALLEEREKEMDALALELKSRREQLETLNRELKTAQASYDETRHASVRAKLEELINQVAALGSELNVSSGRLEEIKGEIEILMLARKRLETLTAKKERFGRLSEISEFIRDMLKKAGPFITEAHLQSISMEANQLYREITGNPMVSLRWDFGYEIILEEEGHERPFISLSGGEQMAAALAVRLALLKELSDMRIAFFDEPTTNMDEERRRNLAQQIGRIKDFDQLFVISHDDAFEGFTDRVVSVGGQAEGDFR